MKNPIVILAALLIAAMQLSVAQAHAMLDHANPRVGSTVTAAPPEVTLWFTEKLEQAFSAIEVRNAAGALVSNGKARVDGGTQLRVGVKALAPGSYKVIWHVLSVDTHRTQGEFTFTVGK